MKRFRAFLPAAAAPALSEPVTIPPGDVTEEWEADRVSHNVPVRAPNAHPRRGVVVRVIGARPRVDHYGRLTGDPRAGRVEVICEDPLPFPANVGAVLTVFTGVMLCDPERDLFPLLDHLAQRRLVTDEQRAAVADQSVGWLRDVAPSRLRALWWTTDPPRYDTPAEYAALVDGIKIALSVFTVLVPDPPFVVEVPPERIATETTRTFTVRADAAEQIRRHNRAN